MSATGSARPITDLGTGGAWGLMGSADFDERVGITNTPRRLTMDDRDDFPGCWTPDSKTVVFQSGRNGLSEDFQNIDSDAPQPLVTGTGKADLPQITSDGRWVLYSQTPDSRLKGGTRTHTRVMRVPIEGGLRREIVPDQRGWPIPRCTPQHGCVLSELGDKSLNVWLLDPLRGKGTLLAASVCRSAGVAPDLTHAYIVEDSEPRNRIRLLSFHGEPSRDIVVANARFLHNLDWLSTGTGFFSVEFGFQRPTLMFITLDGRPRALRAPARIVVEAGIPSPDGKHLAIQAGTGLANLWMMTGF